VECGVTTNCNISRNG